MIVTTPTLFRSPASLRTLFAGAALAALIATPAFAGGDIVKCVAADGRVTITDGDCGGAPSQLLVPAALNTAPGAVMASSSDAAGVSTMAASSMPTRAAQVPAVMHDNWIAPRPRGKLLSNDMATLRAARLSLQAMDQAAGRGRIAAN